MGVAPTYLNNYVDYTQPVSDWVTNASWQAWSDAQSTDASGKTPVIALPMASTASDAGISDSQYQAIAAGDDDSVYQGILQAYAAQGYTNLVVRPGWEMNIPGATYAGDTAQDQADWVSAYQHIYTVLHQEAATLGVNVTVVWNPSITNYTSANALTSLYPGNGYVDAVGADVYADMYPYSDGTNSSGQATYHDWDTGGEDTSVAQFMADPVNREHYWTDPAATEWSNDSSGGHALSLDQLLAFAEAQGKPFAIPETGAGNSNAGTDVSDDATFPQWLAGQLTTAEAAGETVDFVNLWDSNGGGNYEFSNAADNKPAEAAAWAANFGAQTGTAASTTPDNSDACAISSASPVPVSIGTGDTLVLSVSEDAWQGDAQYTVSINGNTIGGILTATASHAAGATQAVSVAGDWGANPTVGITFINDAFGGTPSTDRNLYVDGATYDGQALNGAPTTLLTNGTATLTTPAVNTTVTLHLAEDAWNGDAQYSVAVDGTTLLPNSTVTASNSQGQSQAVSLQDLLSPGTHDLAVSFLNDAYAGSPTTDRNLYVTGVDVDGSAVPGATASFAVNGTQHFQIVVPSPSA